MLSFVTVPSLWVTCFLFIFILFISPVCAGRFSLDFCVGTGFFWQEHQFKTAWQRFVSWHHWKSSILHLKPVVCSVYRNFTWDSLIVALSVTIHRPPLLELCFCAMYSYASQWKICSFVASTAVGLAAFYYANPFWFTRRIQWVVFKGYWKSCRKQISNRSR